MILCVTPLLIDEITSIVVLSVNGKFSTIEVLAFTKEAVIEASAELLTDSSKDNLEVNEVSADNLTDSSVDISIESLEDNEVSADNIDAANEVSADNLAESAAAIPAEAEPDNAVIAPLMSPSADTKAATISLNESKAVASVLEITKSTF
jgi:hypothetical protein